MKLIKQKYKNDCAIACAAMYTGISYFVFEESAEKNQSYVPDTDEGTSVADMLLDRGFDVRHNKRLTVLPCIASIDSIVQPGKGHSVILNIENGRLEILDPSPRKSVTLDHILETATYYYYTVENLKELHPGFTVGTGQDIEL